MAKKIILGDVIGKGKRGIVKKGKYLGKDVAVKILNPKSGAIGRIENESKWMKKLNKYGIGPKFYFYDNNMLVMELVTGIHLKDYLKNNKNTKNVLADLLEQCRVLDKLKVDKQEMHRITKNCIVVDKKPVLIDFERCRNSIKPKNVTQFCNLILKRGLCKDKEKVITALRSYKMNMNDSTFSFLKKLFF